MIKETEPFLFRYKFMVQCRQRLQPYDIIICGVAAIVLGIYCNNVEAQMEMQTRV